MPGPAVYTDIVDVFVFRQRPSAAGVRAHGVEFLQLRRSRPPMLGTWQPVMGHVEQGETAVDAALRELREETGLDTSPAGPVLGFWQLPTVSTFYLASLDRVMICPGFAAEVRPDITVRHDEAHDAQRWVPRDRAERAFIWPGQRLAVELIMRDLVPPDAPLREALRVG